MSECSGSIDSVKRVKLMLNDEEELEDAGLTSSTASKHTSTGTQTEITAGARGLTLFETCNSRDHVGGPKGKSENTFSENPHTKIQDKNVLTWTQTPNVPLLIMEQGNRPEAAKALRSGRST